MQILERKPSLLAQALGGGISEGLQALAQSKLQDIQRRETARGLQALIPGISPEQAHMVSAMNPDLLKAVLPQIVKNTQPNQKQMYTEQKQIAASQKPFQDTLRKAYDAAILEKTTAEDALRLIQTGKTRSGLSGFLPARATLASDETQILEKLYADLQGRIAAEGAGVASRAKIQLAALRKPSLSMSKNAQISMLKRIIRENDKIINLKNTEEEIIRANNDLVPRNLEGLVRDEYARRFPTNLRNTQPQRAMQENQPIAQQMAAQQPRGGVINPFGGNLAQAFNQTAEGELIPGPDENEVAQTARLMVGAGSRLATPAITGYGDLAAAGLGAANYLSSGTIPKYSEVQEQLPISFPTSKNVAEKLSQWTHGYTDPKGPIEEKLYDMASIAGSLFSPAKAVGAVTRGAEKLLGMLGAPLKYANYIGKAAVGPFAGKEMSLLRATGLGAANQITGDFLEGIDAGPITQAMGKLGIMALLGTKGGKATGETIQKEGYDTTKRLFASDKVDIKHTLGEMTGLENYIKKTAPDDMHIMLDIIKNQKEALKKSIKKQKGVTSYKKPVNELIAMKQNLNAIYKRTTHPRVSGEAYFPEHLKDELGMLIGIVKKPIARAGRVNKAAGKAFAGAEEMTKALNTQGKITKFLIKHADKLHQSHATLPSQAMALLTGGTAKIPAEIAKAISFFRTPAGFKIYRDMAKAAAKEQLRPVIQGMAKLEKLDKRQENNPLEEY